VADYQVIDSHVHTYRSREIGRQAMMGTGRTDYGGTIDELLGLMQRAGIEKSVMVNMTPTVDMFEAAVEKLSPGLSDSQRASEEERIRAEIIGRLQRRNDWTCEVARQHPQLIAYIGLDPWMSGDDLIAEIDRCVDLGARGLKLHPAAQRFLPADRRLWPAYERAQDLELPIVYHSGVWSLGERASNEASPKNFPEVLDAFPRLRVVLAHLGFGDFETCAALARDYPNVAFDCCFVVNGTDPNPTLPDEAAVAAFRQVGVDRVMFGTDYPWFDPVLDAQRIQRLPLTDTEKRAVLHDNAVRLLAL
jgi:predicted TIM-barrel fold metal-dependent hydrolase